MKAKALVNSQADTIRQLKAKTNKVTLADKEAKTLLNMLAKREAEVDAETKGDILGNVKGENCSILWLKG